MLIDIRMLKYYASQHRVELSQPKNKNGIIGVFIVVIAGILLIAGGLEVAYMLSPTFGGPTISMTTIFGIMVCAGMIVVLFVVWVFWPRRKTISKNLTPGSL